ncbi:unnamed protein product [Rhizophagus irregularis]|uniref:Uncharacterized protein n=1 Tax=Rhizophagus irregularis TaxID=588596 RepID=A0A2I1GZ00_9GLOM|nr:hypothetical protein RhiirA4_469156 [Rhizophagus irregularis]CAB4404331.1 unnamed protein product [Rhizophagus irregularis]
MIEVFLQKAEKYCFQKINRPRNTNEVTIYIKTREQEVNELLSENHLVIIKNSVNECFGETARDSIDDVSKNSMKESWSRIISDLN